jgi:hypothetical protein
MTDEDQTPGRITVWACPICGYWRQKEDTGIHMFWPDNGRGIAHALVEASYIYECEVK